MLIDSSDISDTNEAHIQDLIQVIFVFLRKVLNSSIVNKKNKNKISNKKSSHFCNLIQLEPH